MTEHEVATQARDILVRRLNVDPSAIMPDTEMTALGIDSLDLVTLAGEFEEAFSVTLPTKEIMRIRTFGDVLTQLTAKVGRAA
jgi:acyl carrier protein